MDPRLVVVGGLGPELLRLAADEVTDEDLPAWTAREAGAGARPASAS
jgi:hypothetical protein